MVFRVWCSLFFGKCSRTSILSRNLTNRLLNIVLLEKLETDSSSVGRASDCRVSGNRIVPGSNPGYRSFFIFIILLNYELRDTTKGVGLKDYKDTANSMMLGYQ